MLGPSTAIAAKKKKFMFEMSKKLEHFRGKGSKAFENLLKEGFDTNKVGNIDMDDWYAHFSSLFLENKHDVSLEDFEQFNVSNEELDKKFTLQELRDAIFYHLHFHKASGPDGIHNGILKWGMEWFQEIILELFNQIWEQKLYPSDWNAVFILPILRAAAILM